MTRISLILAPMMVLSFLLPLSLQGQGVDRYDGPIIDMHVHAYAEEEYPGSVPNPATGELSPPTAEEHRLRSLEMMRRHGVVLASVSGEALAAVEAWVNLDPDRVLPALILGDPTLFMEPAAFADLVRDRRVSVLGEVIAQYEGYSPSDPAYGPYWAIAQEHGIPVAIHTGASFPGTPFMGYPRFRLRYGDPLLLEDMLVEYPELDVYMMHAGGQYHAKAIDMMEMYPRLYTDISVLNWLPGWTELALESFLREAQHRGILDRVLFGSDQMFWPEAIRLAIDRVNSLDFLSFEEKRGIFHDNAARFLRLSEEEIALHHGRRPQEVAPPATAPPTPVLEISPVQTPTAPESVLLDGVEIHFVDQGTGTPVVLVHGSLADYTYWELSDQISLLAAHHRVIAYSRRYNYPNRNERSTNHSPMIEAEDLAALIDRLGTGPFHLVGHSYGAYTALVYALENPEQVRSLVLAEPPIISWLPDIPGGEGIYEGFMASVWKPLAEAFSEGGTAGGLDFTARWYFQVPWEEVTAEWQTLFSRNADEWHALALSTRTFPKVDYDRVGGLDVPVLLLSAGQNAGGFNDLVDGHLERLLPNAERLIIPDVSHEMFLDDREASARAMLDFFRAH